jgi:Uma2 family endonuclease
MRAETAITSSEAGLMTGEELLAMGDIGPCELINGRIVPMAPAGIRHGTIELTLGLALQQFVQSRGLGWVAVGEVGIYTQRNPDRIRGADLVFISQERLPGGLPQGFLEVAPELIVEILSPEDRWQSVRQKIEEYFAIGAKWVWVVEPENRAVLVYRSSTELQKLGEEDILEGEGILEGFTLPVISLFP